MTQRYGFRGETPLWASVILLSGMLAGQEGITADLGYPPPPGPYNSEAPTLPQPPRASLPEPGAGPDDGAARPSQASSRLLPLPDDAFDGEAGRYDAANLFGSAAPAQQTTSDANAQVPHPPADAPASPRFSPPAPPVQKRSGYNDIPMSSGRGNQHPPLPRAYREQGRPAYQGYSPYAPAYPAHQQYYPGGTTGYAPMRTEPGYPGYYSPGYPQTGSGSIQPRDPYPAAGYATEGYYAPTVPQDPYPADTGSPSFHPGGNAIPATIPPAPESAPFSEAGDFPGFRPAD